MDGGVPHTQLTVATVVKRVNCCKILLISLRGSRQSVHVSLLLSLRLSLSGRCVCLPVLNDEMRTNDRYVKRRQLVDV